MGDVNTTSTEPVVKTAEPVQTDKTENAIPYARFKEVNDALKTEREAREKREADDKKSSEDKLLKNKEYEKLIEQRNLELEAERKKSKALEDKAKAYEESQAKLKADALAKLPDDMKKIGEELSVPNLLQFVDKFTNKTLPYSAKNASVSTVAADEYKAKAGETTDQYMNRLRTIPKRVT